MKKSEIAVKIDGNGKQILHILKGFRENVYPPTKEWLKGGENELPYLVYGDGEWTGAFGEYCTKHDLTKVDLNGLIEILLAEKKESETEKPIAVKVTTVQQAKVMAKHLGKKYDLGDFRCEIAIYLVDNHPELGLKGCCYDFLPNVPKDHTIISFSDFVKQHGIKIPLITSMDGVDLCKGEKYSLTWKLCDKWIVLGSYPLNSNDGVITNPTINKAFKDPAKAQAWCDEQNGIILLQNGTTATKMQDFFEFNCPQNILSLEEVKELYARL